MNNTMREEMTESDQKYLAEKMGLCWHEWGRFTPEVVGFNFKHIYGYERIYYQCLVCEKVVYEENKCDQNPDFSSEHGFFVAWKWGKKQEWWSDFLNEVINIDLIGPRFAEELVVFLRKREDK